MELSCIVPVYTHPSVGTTDYGFSIITIITQFKFTLHLGWLSDQQNLLLSGYHGLFSREWSWPLTSNWCRGQELQSCTCNLPCPHGTERRQLYLYRTESFEGFFGQQVLKKTKLHGLSPPANYTDRATAACRRSDCQLFADRGCHVRQRDWFLRPYSRFSRQEPLLFYQAAPQLYSRGWVDPGQQVLQPKKCMLLKIALKSQNK
jgi:hypothetical protein